MKFHHLGIATNSLSDLEKFVQETLGRESVSEIVFTISQERIIGISYVYEVV